MNLQIKRFISVLLLLIVIFSVSSCVSNTDSPNNTRQIDTEERNHGSDVSEKDDNSKKILSTAEIAARLMESTVLIASSNDNMYTFGTGFIASSEGYIVTSYHTIEDYPVIQVTLNNNQTINAEVVGYSKFSNIAVLKVDRELNTAILGDSDEVAIGIPTYAIEKTTFSQGIVSGVDNKVSDSFGNYISELNCFLTTSTQHVNCTSGVVCNQYGEIIGLSMFYAYETTNSVNVLPINGVMKIANAIITTGSVADTRSGYSRVRPKLGIHGFQIKIGEPYLSGSLAKRDGYVVTMVDSSGVSYGVLEVGDIIYQIEGSNIVDENQLIEALYNCNLDKHIQIKVDRQGSQLDLEITFTKTNE